MSSDVALLPSQERLREPASQKLFCVGLALIFVYPLWWWVETWVTGSQPVRHEQIALLIASAGWLLAVRNCAATSLCVIVIAAIALRLLLLPSPPSDDVYRYIWEGRVRAAGFNPYLLPPESAELGSLRDSNYEPINHKYHAAIYPPLSQILFVAVARISPSVLAFKLVFLVFDVAIIGILAHWLRKRTGDWRRVAVYALCPLVLLGIAREAHLDVLSLFGLALLLYFADAARMAPARHGLWLGAGAGLGIAIGTKLFPLVLLPWAVAVAWHSSLAGWQEKLSAVAAVGIAALGVPLLTTFFYFDGDLSHFLVEDVTVLAPLRNFAANYHSLDVGQQLLRMVFSEDRARLFATGLIALGAMAIAVFRSSPATAQLSMFSWLLLWMPTVHPWYVLWIVPALCAKRGSAWIALPIAIILALEGNHLREVRGEWSMPGWVGPTIVAIVAAAFVLNVAIARSARAKTLK